MYFLQLAFCSPQPHAPDGRPHWCVAVIYSASLLCCSIGWACHHFLSTLLLANISGGVRQNTGRRVPPSEPAHRQSVMTFLPESEQRTVGCS